MPPWFVFAFGIAAGLAVLLLVLGSLLRRSRRRSRVISRGDMAAAEKLVDVPGSTPGRGAVRSARDEMQNELLHEETPFTAIRFDEQPIGRIEQAFERLTVQGMLVCEPATEESRVLARIPEHAGPVFRALARRYRSIGFPEVGVRIVLHDGEVADDALGGWRLRAEPDELDIRLPPAAGWPGASSGDHIGDGIGDEIIDATWSPRSGSEVAQHSTILHFIVRAAVGERI